MQITIQLNGGEQPHELNALAALIASLGGRAPTASPVMPELTSTFSNDPVEAANQFRQIVRTPGDDDGEPRNTDTSELDADVIDAAVLAGAPDRDADGLPWDERIHSGNHGTVANGTWRRRKNTPDELFESVMAELRAAHPTATADVPPPPPATTINDTPEPPAPTVADTAPVAAAVTTADSSEASAVPPPPANDGPDLSSFAKFVQAVSDKDVPTEVKTYAVLAKIASENFDVPALKDMKDKPGQWRMFYDMVG